MNILELLTDPDFVVKGIPVTRRTKDTDKNGRTKPITVMSTISGNVQPATPKERETLPEAERNKDTIAVSSLEELSTGDTVIYHGQAHDVASVERWDEPLGTYYKILAVCQGGSDER
jgi:hypothetical protein